MPPPPPPSPLAVPPRASTVHARALAEQRDAALGAARQQELKAQAIARELQDIAVAYARQLA